LHRRTSRVGEPCASELFSRQIEVTGNEGRVAGESRAEAGIGELAPSARAVTFLAVDADILSQMNENRAT
jgi:hypothetical protein